MKDRKSDEQPGQSAPMDVKAATTKRGKDASLGREVQAKIGQQLRAYYDGLIEPAPERFVELLRQLEKPGGGGSSNGS